MVTDRDIFKPQEKQKTKRQGTVNTSVIPTSAEVDHQEGEVS